MVWFEKSFGCVESEMSKNSPNSGVVLAEMGISFNFLVLVCFTVFPFTFKFCGDDEVNSRLALDKLVGL